MIKSFYIYIIYILACLCLFNACEQLEIKRHVIINTGEVTDTTSYTAIVAGEILDIGETGLIQFGHCWSTSENPTVSLETKTELGSRNSSTLFNSALKILEPNTTYYVRAYATNSVETFYGDTVSFKSRSMVITNGGFNDDAGWTVYNLDSYDVATVEFGYTADGPSAGDGIGLHITSSITQNTNVLVFQAVTVKSGKTYQVSAAFKVLDIIMGETDGRWSELYIDPEAPVEGSDWVPPNGSNIPLMAFYGCFVEGIDGTYQDDGCNFRGPNTNLYVAPGDNGDIILVYIGIKTGGFVENPPDIASYDIVIDELRMVEID